MINIYIFNEGSRAAIYGIGTYISELTRFLKNQKNISLNVVQLHSEKEEFTIEKENGYNVFYFPPICPSNFSIEHPDCYYKNVWHILSQYIKQNSKDKLVFHLNYDQERCLIPLIKNKFPKCKTIFTIHYQIWALILNGNYCKFKNIIKSKEQISKDIDQRVIQSYKDECSLYSAIDTIICLGDYMRKMLMEDYDISNNKIHVINNGIIDEGIILPMNQRDKIKAQYHIPKDEKIILFVGRLDEIKGISTLIEAFKLLIKQYKDCHLLVVGGGSIPKYLQETSGYWRKISFTGRLEKQTVYELYKIADVGVMLSSYEPFGYVAIEMMMFNIPLIVTDTSGLKEIVHNGINGWKVPIKKSADNIEVSPITVKNKILNILLNKDSSKEFHVRSTFLQKYEAEIMKEHYLSLYKSIQ